MKKDEIKKHKPDEMYHWLCKGELKGRKNMRKEILKFIEYERDNGNFGEIGSISKKKDGFSAALCLSALIKLLQEDKHDI